MSFSKLDGDQYFERNISAKHDNDEILRNFNINNFKNINLLEIGCCDGWRLNKFNKLNNTNKYFGIDISNKSIEYGKSVFDNLNLEVGDICNLSYSDQQFDVVLVPFVLMYINRINLLKAISELDRVLKNNGLLIITDFYPNIPKKISFKHNNDLYTYKQKFYEMFISTNNYYIQKLNTFTHITSLNTSNKYDDLCFYVELKKDLSMI